MRNSILRGLSLVAALALVVPAAFAQDVVVDTLFTFEGDDGMGDVSGWESTQDADTLSNGTAPADIKVVTQKAVSQTDFIDAFEGDYLLEATPNRGLKARTFRGAKYAWATPQDWTNRSTVKLAASMNARGANFELHEYRIRVISGTGADADTVEAVFEGLKSEGADDNTPFNSFVNDWELLEVDLSEDDDFDLTQITQLDVAGRNTDDTIINNNGEQVDVSEGNWGGLVHVDLVTIEGANPGGGTFAEDQPGLNSLSQAYPNPAAGRTALDLDVETAQDVSVRVVDVLGRTVQTAFDGTVASTATLTIDAASLAPGTYVVLVQGETFAQSRRLTVAR